MSNFIPILQYTESQFLNSSKLIVYCCNCKENNEKAISINVELAKMLSKCNKNRRWFYLDKLFNKIIESLPSNSVIKDFDVMFNPQYKVDVLRIMEIACKRKKFSIIWPGVLKDENLVYADCGFQDYKLYNINEYDLICVI